MPDDVLESRMRAAATGALRRLRGELPALRPRTIGARVGEVDRVADGVASIVGLTETFAGELLAVGRVTAIAEELSTQEVRAVLLGDARGVDAGTVVRRLGRALDVPAGAALVGRVVDPLGRALDRAGELATRDRALVNAAPIALVDREPVSRPLRTGIFAVDTMIPIGRGQRQLVVGDRATGKTELCLDMLAGLDRDTIGVYVAIGRRGSETATHLDWLRRAGFFEHGFAVVADADDPPGLVHLAPYAGCAMAESLASAGRDVVVVYDDLTTHAHVHRTLALLLGRPVGREAHPPDIFYAHARLLERSSQLGASRGGGSLTAFPIVETQGGDLTAYIPTNLVSITDGQIRLDAGLVAANVLPAVDVGLSVSRVGGKAQEPLLRRLAGSFKNRYAQFLELESFARFGARLEASAQRLVDWGRRVRRVLNQPRGAVRTRADTVARLLVVETDAFAELGMDDLETRIEAICATLLADPAVDGAGIAAGRVGPEAIEALREAALRIVAQHVATAPPEPTR